MPKNSTLKVGNKMTIGFYEWIVLAVETDRALLITKDCGLNVRYQNGDKLWNTTWDSCSMRDHLNNNFFNHLPARWQKRVIEVTNENPNNPEYGAVGGPSTRDRVFLLSIDEANKYFKSNNERVAKSVVGVCTWWLRSPGFDDIHATYVNVDGCIVIKGQYVSDRSTCLRPAMWIEIKSAN
jgi:hypothetical protein